MKTINGGDDTDTLVSTSAVFDAVAADLTTLTNVEQLQLSDALNGDITLSYFGTIARVNTTAAIYCLLFPFYPFNIHQASGFICNNKDCIFFVFFGVEI